MDDPREILKAAGVECAELSAWLHEADDETSWNDGISLDAAILALARLVAKYKWQRDYLAETFAVDIAWWEDRLAQDPMTEQDVVDMLDRRWAEREEKR